MQSNEEPDFSTKAGASILASKIADYWCQRGYEVMVQLEEMGFHPALRTVRCEIRSNLVNGLPRTATTIG